VKSQRSSRGAARTKPTRRGQGQKRAPVERFVLGKASRGRDGILARSWARIAGAGLHRRPIWLLTGILIVGSFVAAIVAGGYVPRAFRSMGEGADAVVADAGFGISSVHLSGNVRTQPSQILAALRLEPGQSLFGADIQGARQRLLALDWVADAQVRRQYPDSVTVSLVEKLPFALWQTPSGLYVVERSGRVITRAGDVEFPHLPFLLGDGAPQSGAELVDAIAQHRAVVARVKAMERVSNRRWNLLLDDGVVVELPETGWAMQLDELEHLIVDKAVLERDIREIDLRSPDNLFFQLKNGDKQQQQTTRGNQT
jgi:cell division protein FtsQ